MLRIKIYYIRIHVRAQQFANLDPDPTRQQIAKLLLALPPNKIRNTLKSGIVLMG